MSVLSRPVRHRAPAPTQREVRIPLPRDASSTGSVQRTDPEVRRPVRPGPAKAAPRRPGLPALLALGVVGALAIGGATWTLLDDGAEEASVIAPAYVPTATDLARDRALEARGPDPSDVRTPLQAQIDAARLSEAARDAARAANAPVTSVDARQTTEAERDAAMERRARLLGS